MRSMTNLAGIVLQLGRGIHDAVLERQARVLRADGAPLRREGVLLAGHGEARQQRARLEHGGCVAEHEVHCAGDRALLEELAVAVGVQRVLVAFQGDTPEGALVALHLERDRLVVHGARGVLDGEVAAEEVRGQHRCTPQGTQTLDVII